MNLPKLFEQSPQNMEAQEYIGLIISELKIQVLWIKISEGQTEIIKKSRILEYDNEEAALNKTDEALQDLGSGSEDVNQTIFCLDPSWVKDDDIADEKKPLIKNITTKLSLEPLGFIINSESLANYHVLNTPTFSGILMLFSSTRLSANLVVQGSQVAFEEVGRSDNVVADVEEALARFASKIKESGQPLPAQLILASFDLMPEDLRKQQQQLLEYSWVDQGIFVRTPTIDLVAEDKLLEIFSSQTSRAIMLSQGGGVKDALAATPLAMGVSELADTQLESEDELSDEPVDDSEQEPELIPEPAMDDQLERAIEPEATSFGVPIRSEQLTAEEQLNKAKPGDFGAEFSEVEGTGGNKLANFMAKLKRPYDGNKTPRFFVVVGLLGGILALMLVGFLSLFFGARATVDLDLEKQPISEQVEIIVDPQADETDPGNRILAAKEVSKSIEGQSSMQTTGIKLVGDSAKGKVTIYNKTSAEKTFPQGTSLTSGGYTFLTDTEVTVASASTQPKDGGEVVDYGHNEVGVTAVEIGEEGNLPPDSEFVVEKFDASTYSGTALAELTGGESREVRVVAEEDLLELLNDLREELLSKAEEEFKADAQDGEYFIVTSNFDNETATYNAEESDEAEDLQLNLSVEVTAYAYTANDLKPIAQQVLSDKIPQGFRLSDEDPQILSEAGDIDTESGQIILSASVSSNALPDLNQDDLIKAIQGQSIDEAKTTLLATSGIKGVEVTLKPGYAKFFVRSLPRNPNKIELVIK